MQSGPLYASGSSMFSVLYLADLLWNPQCKSVPKRGRLCEQTLEQTPSSDGSPACFEVLDLSKDAQYSSLPFVAGEPHFR